MFAGVLAWLARALAVLDLIDAESLLARLAIDEQIVEQVVVPACLPHLRVHDNARIETDHGVTAGSVVRRPGVVVRSDHIVPPGVLQISLHLHAKRTVVPEPADSAVDLTRLKYEPAPLAQGNDLLHGVVAHTFIPPK